MIDKETGAVTIQSIPLKLGPEFTRSDLLSLPLGSRSEVVNEPYHSYSIGEHRVGGLSFAISLYFCGQKLDSVGMAHVAPGGGASWDDWSEEKEMKRKEAHDRWLAEQLGDFSRDYSRGSIRSDYDSRSGGSSILIRYSRQGQPLSGA